METFRGRRIITTQGLYPAVYWPEHTEAMSNGIVYIHRIVAHEVFGGIPEGMFVHHIDEDKSNWSPDNLEIMSQGAHSSLHNNRGLIYIRRCFQCGILFKVKRRRFLQERAYCSQECFRTGSEKIEWPETDDLLDMVENNGYSETGRILGVSGNAVRKRVKTRTTQTQNAKSSGPTHRTPLRGVIGFRDVPGGAS